MINFKFRYIYFLLLILLLISYSKKSELGASTEMRKELFDQPIQKEIPEGEKSKFSMSHFQKTYEVETVAEYSLSGLVVSHNNITGWGDIYHDETSLDTKDLCVIWGDNLKSNDFNLVSFSSGSWTCYFRYNRGVHFDKFQLSNNHLITDNQNIREIINKVSLGDQIHIKGQLVNYREMGQEFWRKSSLTRKDAGNTACEVVFVKAIEIIKSKNVIWRFLFKFSKYSIFFIFLGQMGLFFYNTHKTKENLD